MDREAGDRVRELFPQIVDLARVSRHFLGRVVLMGVLAHVADYDEARSIVRRLLDPLPSGSHLAVRDETDTDEAYVEATRQYNAGGAVPYNLRSPERIAGFLDGLELVEPGVVSCPLWRPETTSPTPVDEVPVYGGVGRKP